MPTFRGVPADLVIDVRSRVEHFFGHLPGSINVPVDSLPGALASRADVTHDARIVLYCASGARSAAAAAALRAAGYRRVTDAGAMANASPEYAA